MKAAGGMGGLHEHERQSVACDVAVIVFEGDLLRVLLIRRKNPPFAGQWALPGGFVDRDETLEEAAAREVEEETGIRGLRLWEVGAFGDPGRDPRGRTISIAWMALARSSRIRPRAGDDAAEAAFFPLRRPPELAFDHDRILERIRKRLRRKAVFTPCLFDLLPRRISGESFRQLCREVMGRRYPAETFARRLSSIPCLQKLETVAGDVIYRFERREYFPGGFAFLLEEE